MQERSENLIDVALVCLLCRSFRTIHVFRDRRPPAVIIWECFECQKEEKVSPLSGEAAFSRKRAALSGRRDRPARMFGRCGKTLTEALASNRS
jgi:hypothetical protein